MVSNLHFAPTKTSKNNLIAENKSEEDIIITGNTVIDALSYSVEKVNTPTFQDQEVEQLKTVLDENKKLILVTGHRRENHGDGFV